MPTETFFPPKGLRGSSLRSLERDAKKVCAECPVVARCLQHALESNEPFGIWGGMTSTERYRLTTGSDRVSAPAPEPKPHRIGPPLRPYKRLQRVDTD